MSKHHILDLVGERIGQLGTWLEDEASHVERDQGHLDAGSCEQAYWHHGYRAALCDVLALLRHADGGIPGTANRFPSAAPDE